MKKRLISAGISVLLLSPTIAGVSGILPGVQGNTDLALLIGLYSAFVGAPLGILLAGCALFPRTFETYHPIEHVLPDH